MRSLFNLACKNYKNKTITAGACNLYNKQHRHENFEYS